jgi:hypothetical protein
MNPENFNLLFEFHFIANHHFGERCISHPTAEQFRRPPVYPLGPVPNQMVHLMIREIAQMEEMGFLQDCNLHQQGQVHRLA